jgi:hyperosmotically inducible protein
MIFLRFKEAYMSLNTERGAAEKLLDDTAITSKIKAKYLADDIVSALDIKVITDNSNVILTGEVSSEKAAQQAVEIAKNTAGVKDVISKLEVK